MSRCYPFPPPGYIRNAPVEMELPAKKEKRKHKDKKKKKKKHSATNNDLVLQDKDTPLEEVQESGLANEGFKPERGRSPETKSALSTSTNQDVIQRLQNENLREEGFSNCVLATNSERPKERPQLHKLKNERLPNGVLAANVERLQAGRPRENGGLGTDDKRSKHSIPVNSTAEVLVNGMLAMPNKRLKVENPRENMLLNGSAASSWKRPEQGLQADNLVNEVYSNGVLSSKRKRLQADHHGDKLIPSSGVLANNCRKSQQGTQAGYSKDEVFLNDVRATSSMRLQTDRTSDKFLSKPFPSERADQSLRADKSSIKVMRDGVQATGIQAGGGNGKELSHHMRASSSRLQVEKPKHEVSANGSECSKLQADNLRAQIPSSNHLLGSRGGRCEPNLQARMETVANGVPDSSVGSLVASNSSEKVLSGAMLTTNCRRSEQTLQSDRLTKEVVPSCVPTGSASTKIVQVGGSAKAEAVSSVVRAATNGGAEQRLHVHNSRHEARAKVVLDAGRLQTDNSQSKMPPQGAVVTSHEKCDQRLQENQVNKGKMSNGAVAGNREELAAEGKIKSPLAGRATNSSDAAIAKDVAPASRVTLECDDELIRLFRPLARRPLAELPADDEDWLVSCNKELQLKAREKWDTQIPQVWEEAVLLPVVGIHALPYVVPD